MVRTVPRSGRQQTTHTDAGEVATRKEGDTKTENQRGERNPSHNDRQRSGEEQWINRGTTKTKYWNKTKIIENKNEKYKSKKKEHPHKLLEI